MQTVRPRGGGWSDDLSAKKAYFAHVPSLSSPTLIVDVFTETVLNCLLIVTPTPQALQSHSIPSVNTTAVISALKPLKRREEWLMGVFVSSIQPSLCCSDLTGVYFILWVHGVLRQTAHLLLHCLAQNKMKGSVRPHFQTQVLSMKNINA